VMVSTHYMDEAEHCDRLALIYGGRIVARGSPAELKRSVAERNAREGVAISKPTLEDVFVSLVRAA
jgi:ABC-2 type transport system ATP-binding protein